MNYLQLSQEIQIPNLFHRYITNEHIKPIIFNLNSKFKVQVEGKSVLGNDIFSVQFGVGKTKIFIWSQMHGNESTCTKALMDLLKLLKDEHEMSQFIHSNFTLFILPLVNPDGAIAFTRENANGVDLNRDAKNCTQPESVLLHEMFNDFEPDFCFNMHDQRTIYGVGNTKKPASVAFLSPSFNENRDINEVRAKAMGVISDMNNELQKHISGYVARFDDGFNDNCFGEYFTMQNVPTILFEGGHFPDDYARDKVRNFIFTALLSGFKAIYENDIVNNKIEDYFNIPQNNPIFYDFLYKNVKIIANGNEKIINFAAQYNEVVQENKIVFEAVLVLLEDNKNYFGHIEYDLEGELFSSNFCQIPENDIKADFFIGKNKEFVNGLIKN